LAETTLEFVKRHLDSEVQSKALHLLPSNFYSRISEYSQKLRRSAGSGNSEAAIRLISRQTTMIESMTRQLIVLRTKKATEGNGFLQLLPEERYVCSTQQRFQRRFNTFIEALSTGQPSFIEFAHKSETMRNTTVRFLRPINELVGVDFRRYGPFEVDDLASIPAANADILIAGGEAVEVYIREES
jgi:DNA replication initiation complex subunit (GINS family)